jgi:hypothetical protein
LPGRVSKSAGGSASGVVRDIDEIDPDSNLAIPSPDTGELGVETGYDTSRLSITVGVSASGFQRLGIPANEVPLDLIPISFDHIRSAEMGEVWMSTTPPLRVEDVAVLAADPEDVPEAAMLLETHPHRVWLEILREIITHDAFGADRMDYLLRDSLHIGVAYGRFDHYRLIDTMRILPPPPQGRAPVS